MWKMSNVYQWVLNKPKFLSPFLCNPRGLHYFCIAVSQHLRYGSMDLYAITPRKAN